MPRLTRARSSLTRSSSPGSSQGLRSIPLRWYGSRESVAQAQLGALPGDRSAVEAECHRRAVLRMGAMGQLIAFALHLRGPR